jgi:aminoglycoside phosphotransferase (APT) family kinase protein
MSADPLPPGSDELDAGRIAAWLADVVDPSVSAVRVSKLAGGHSSGAWRLDVVAEGHPGPMVLKAPDLPSIVYRRDAGREGRIVDALSRLGAPVPAVLAVDAGSTVVGRPCFVMEYVDGRSVPDSAPAGCHGDGWFRDAGVEAQRSIWDSFHDALAALHRVDATKVPDASFGPNGVVDVLDYWREALLDAAPAENVPRQLALLEWLRGSVPAGADDDAGVCIGDARLVNCLIRGAEVRGLVDFEIAYIGNPAADIGYSVFFDSMQRQQVERPAEGIPSEEHTWARWGEATGRSVEHRHYWTAFGAAMLCVTATRAMIQWGFSDREVETDNTIVSDWEAVAERAAT